MYFIHKELLALTDTGSYARDVTGYTLKYKSTQTHYEYEYRLTAKPFEFNATTNISATPGRSGSLTLPLGRFQCLTLPPGDRPSGQGTGSLKTFYNAATRITKFHNTLRI